MDIITVTKVKEPATAAGIDLLKIGPIGAAFDVSFGWLV
jgi:hypothetical protein